MNLNQDAIIKIILKSEGGYVNHPFDRGGATNFGITQAALGIYRGRSVSADDVKNMTVEEAVAIYKKNYWDKMNLDLIQSEPVRLALFDQGVNRGTKTAIVQAQVVLSEIGVKTLADGVLGPKTASALESIHEYDFAREYLQASELAYADICVRRHSQIVFIKGWLNRVHKLQDIIFAFDDKVELPKVEKVIEERPEIVPGKDIMAPYLWAVKEIGQQEVAGRKHNPRIVWYHSFTTLKATQDEVPWCSSFMCAAAESNGFKSTDSAAAKSWLTYGDAGDGSIGDIAVFSRDGGNHVAFVNKKFSPRDSVVNCLGGNQSNKVCVQDYSAGRLLAFRRFKAS